MIKRIIHSLGRGYISRVVQSETEAQRFKRWNERPVEFRFVFEQLTRLCGSAQTVLDVGTGTTALPHLMANCGFVVTAIDNMRDYWDETMVNRHFHVIDDDVTNSSLKTSSYDVATCVSVLEHIPPHGKAMATMHRVVKPGGHLILTIPYHETEYHPNVYEHSESSYGRGIPYVAQSYSRAELDQWLALGFELAEQEFWHLWSGKLWTCGEKLNPPRRTSSSEPHQLTCLLLRKV
jgi:SAM-dependent methyltransferase